jgi:AhpD family alkylhydroperoxidase
MVGLRASQINGCAVCLDKHGRGAMKAGETDGRLFTLADRRQALYFTQANPRIPDLRGQPIIRIAKPIHK